MVATAGAAPRPSKRARIARHDPYKSFNFRVEIDGMTAAFTEVSGLESEIEAIDYREGGPENRMRKLPGLRTFPNIVLKRGLTQDAELWNWHQQVADGNVHRRNGSVFLLDDHGQEQVRWNFYNSWPCKYIGPTLNAKSNDGDRDARARARGPRACLSGWPRSSCSPPTVRVRAGTRSSSGSCTTTSRRCAAAATRRPGRRH